MSTTSTDEKEPTASVVSSLSDAPLYEAAKKAHAEKQAAFQAVADRAEGPHEHAYECQTGGVFKCACGAVSLLAEPGTEPPLTPEEEALAPEDANRPDGWCVLNHPGCDGSCGTVPLTSALPQPVRRPPYAVAYSVDGHLYEVALPGDATVTAVDGALIIKHGLGQVAGIVGIQPIESKEAS